MLKILGNKIPNILKELGFKDITNPGMLNTAGRFMTIPKGAAMKKIPIETIKESFINHGYEIKE
jgi:selenophosphate synthetase-related protein